MLSGTDVRMGARAGLASIAVLAALGACSRGGGAQDETSWARAALERNATLEVVASDASTGVITVRVKSSGELRTVRPGELIAALPPGLPASGPPSAPQATPPAAPPPASLAPPPAAPAAAEASAASSAPAAPAPEAPSDRPPPGVHPTDTAGKHILASGPGYSIAAADASAPRAAGSSASPSPARNIAVELRHEPIICQGPRLYHIDNRNLAFDGNALAAEDGCELHITNSRIAANGIGISARAANVHIENSTIEGEPSAIDASGGAQVFAQSSTFKGTIVHNDTAAFHDLGGNVGD